MSYFNLNIYLIFIIVLVFILIASFMLAFATTFSSSSLNVFKYIKIQFFILLLINGIVFTLLFYYYHCSNNFIIINNTGEETFVKSNMKNLIIKIKKDYDINLFCRFLGDNNYYIVYQSKSFLYKKLNFTCIDSRNNYYLVSDKENKINYFLKNKNALHK